jgi:iron complex outermembrane receptor protein
MAGGRIANGANNGGRRFKGDNEMKLRGKKSAMRDGLPVGTEKVGSRKNHHASHVTSIWSCPPRLSLVGAAVAACLCGGRIAGAQDAAAGASSRATASNDQLQEVVVTAQRRVENVQNVPIAIQVMTSEVLQQQNIQNFDDLVKFLPGVAITSVGPGQGNIFIRGLSIGSEQVNGAGSDDDFPNVGVYLDDQSVAFPGRNLDVYAADLQRVEVLKGPQGTLFGAGAESGAIRYITNKPQLDVFDGNFSGGYAFTSHGTNSGKAIGVVNLPLISDTLAVRLVAYDEHRGGYINNVPGTFVRQSTDAGIHYAGYVNNVPGPPTLLNSVSNNNLVANAINPLTYDGVRVGALWKFNDNWNALLMQQFQDMDEEGVFYSTPYSSGTGSQAVKLPELSVQLYNPSYDHDRFQNTALTVNGRIGALNFVYSGAYLVRNTDQIQDYTNYARGTYADYYQCVPPPYTPAGQCYSPSSSWHEHERDVHQSHEMRLESPSDWRLRFIGGIFWENFRIYDQLDWMYKTAPGFTNIAPPPGATSGNPNIRNDNTSFFDDATRGYKQRAAYASVDFDIIPKILTVTGGTRFFRFDNIELGSAVGSFGCYDAGPPPCLASANNLDALALRNTNIGSRSRVNLTWHITPSALLYYTWSQGFRPGGFNRSSHYSSVLNYRSPISFAPDTLTNNEFGWKTEWFNHALQINGDIYEEKWTNVQTSFFDPQGKLGNLAFFTNGPNYRVRGLELQFNWIVAHGLTVGGSAAWDSSSLLNSPFLYDVEGQPITSIPNAYGTPGSTLANSPAFQGNLHARYQFSMGDYNPFVQFGGQHRAHSHTATGFANNYDVPAYSTYDAAVGVDKQAWTVQLQCENLADSRAATYVSSSESVLAITPIRPRTCGMNFNYKFTGN